MCAWGFSKHYLPMYAVKCGHLSLLTDGDGEGGEGEGATHVTNQHGYFPGWALANGNSAPLLGCNNLLEFAAFCCSMK